VFCALHDQLASLGRHAQLTHCFSAVAELLVLLDLQAVPYTSYGLPYTRYEGHDTSFRITSSELSGEVEGLSREIIFAVNC